MAAIVLSGIGGGLTAIGAVPAISIAVSAVAGIAGLAGAVLILMGACLLLLRRLTDPAVKNSTKPGDIFNLTLFIAAFALLLGGYVTRDAATASLSQLALGALRFDTAVKIGGCFGSGLILAAALAAYIPFTHMAHYVAKYFTWHTVRWDDRRAERGGPMEGTMTEYLNYKPSWAATHVGADGEKSWAQIATTAPAEEVRK
jgi:nitrate reductase gamma subunit